MLFLPCLVLSCYIEPMAPNELRNRFRGVFGFPVTPFRPDLSLDLDALARNVDEMARYPFCALVAAGGTGGMDSLTVGGIIDVGRVTGQAAAGAIARGGGG